MIHAEEDAINNLPINNKKPIYVSMIVVKLSNDCFSNSMPCSMCVDKIIKAKNKGYIISKIYYSDIHGDIIKINLNDIHLLPKKYSAFYKNI